LPCGLEAAYPLVAGGARCDPLEADIHPLLALDPPPIPLSIADPLAGVSALVERLQATAHELDREGAVPTREVRLLAEAGLMAAPVPSALGGRGIGTEAGGSVTLLALLAGIGRGR
jgi:hypothetical protein